jgi:hypothetical protein
VLRVQRLFSMNCQRSAISYEQGLSIDRYGRGFAVGGGAQYSWTVVDWFDQSRRKIEMG